MHDQEKGKGKCFIPMHVVGETEDGLAKGWLAIVGGMEREKHVLCILPTFHAIRW
jgi:hypothetical protein